MLSFVLVCVISTADFNNKKIIVIISSMFITAVDEKEIIDMVPKCKIKVSTDWIEINLTTLMRVVDGIAKPLTSICDLSFLTGKSPRNI